MTEKLGDTPKPNPAVDKLMREALEKERRIY